MAESQVKMRRVAHEEEHRVVVGEDEVFRGWIPAALDVPESTKDVPEVEINLRFVEMEEMRRALSRLRDGLVGLWKASLVSLVQPSNVESALYEARAMLQDSGKKISALSERFLSVNGIYKVEALKRMVEEFALQLVIYGNELEFIKARKLAPNAQYVAAFFVRQPRMQPIKRKQKKAEKGSSKKKQSFVYEIQFVKGAIFDFELSADSILPCLTILEDSRAKVLRGTVVPVECCSLSVRADKCGFSVGVAFPDGTQVVPSVLNVVLDGVLKVDNQAVFNVQGLECAGGNCIVVTTNENQWEHAEERLLRRQLYGDIADESSDSTAAWPRVWNGLVEFFMRATRQDLLESELFSAEKASLLPLPQRCLTLDDLGYFHSVWFGNSASISYGRFRKFWEWFGPLSHQYRHNNSIRALYLGGLIFGFVEADACSSMLSGQREGTFLIRSSETSLLGEFTISFVGNNSEVQHYKIDHKKLKPPFGNLADFVSQKEQLKFVVVRASRSPKLLPKAEAFAEFLTE